MSAHELSAHVHHEDADDEHNKAGERRTRWVVVLAAVMMVGELIVGKLTGSKALEADGWHMGTHVGALGLTLVAYWYARTRAGNDAFSFGTGKVYALAGYTSGVVLAIVALLLAVESIEHLLDPDAINYNEALLVAAIGLAVNVGSVFLLGKGHHYGHRHGHGHHHHDHGHHDHHDDHQHTHEHRPERPQAGTLDFNMRAAYIHVLADALTSVMAIIALALGKFAGLWFLDPAMGILGGVVIVVWAGSLCRQASRQLLDVVSSAKHEQLVRQKLEAIDDVRVADLHVWELGPGRRSCIVSIVTSSPREVSFYRDTVLGGLSLAHLTIEIHQCELNHVDAHVDAHAHGHAGHQHEH
ncbi:MAG: CDF family Co(II)/Ni(II) efflux transporter DmeF [Kofleriaceae bacterium]|nr:CDF family Co(II)/Ni(II) efflux transporter DmeF [Kofleriaceae bacterium]